MKKVYSVLPFALGLAACSTSDTIEKTTESHAEVATSSQDISHAVNKLTEVAVPLLSDLRLTLIPSPEGVELSSQYFAQELPTLIAAYLSVPSNELLAAAKNLVRNLPSREGNFLEARDAIAEILALQYDLSDPYVTYRAGILSAEIHQEERSRRFSKDEDRRFYWAVAGAALE